MSWRLTTHLVDSALNHGLVAPTPARKSIKRHAFGRTQPQRGVSSSALLRADSPLPRAKAPAPGVRHTLPGSYSPARTPHVRMAPAQNPAVQSRQYAGCAEACSRHSWTAAREAKSASVARSWRSHTRRIPASASSALPAHTWWPHRRVWRGQLAACAPIFVLDDEA